MFSGTSSVPLVCQPAESGHNTIRYLLYALASSWPLPAPKVNTEGAWNYRKDTTFDYSHPQYPQVPVQTNSLHVGYYWNRTKKLIYDGHHASAAGCYLGGVVWYAVLFNECPEKLTFKPVEVTQQFANYLKQTAARTVQPQ